MAKKKQDDGLKEGTQMEIGRVSFAFNLTRDEADKIINHPKHPVAKKLRRYMKSILEAAAKKMLESKPEEIVKDCKLNIE